MNYLDKLGLAQLQAIIALVVLAIVFGLVVLVWKQRQRIQTLEERQQRVGFLGKQLAPVALVAVLVAGVITSAALSQRFVDGNNSGVSVSGDEKVEYHVQTKKTFLQNGQLQVVFNFVPLIADRAWGGDRQDLEYDVYWEITGATSTYKIELDLTAKRPGGFTLNLEPGTYKVKLDIFRGNQSWKHEEDISL
jgi:hypothetical protein